MRFDTKPSDFVRPLEGEGLRRNEDNQQKWLVVAVL
jgi:hypothetical protein